MDKLIVTLIGIGLSAVTIVSSMDYMSGLYRNAQSTARAQKWITGAAQITAAARQAGNLSTSGDNWQQGSATAATAAVLVPDYLSDLPRHNGLNVFWPCYITGGNTVCPRYNTDATILQAVVENAAVCQEIQKLANRGTTTLSSTSVSGTNPIAITSTIAVNPNQQFTCLNASGTYYFLYRVFMDR